VGEKASIAKSYSIKKIKKIGNSKKGQIPPMMCQCHMNG